MHSSQTFLTPCRRTHIQRPTSLHTNIPIQTLSRNPLPPRQQHQPSQNRHHERQPFPSFTPCSFARYSAAVTAKGRAGAITDHGSSGLCGFRVYASRGYRGEVGQGRRKVGRELERHGAVVRRGESRLYAGFSVKRVANPFTATATSTRPPHPLGTTCHIHHFPRTTRQTPTSAIPLNGRNHPRRPFLRARILFPPANDI